MHQSIADRGPGVVRFGIDAHGGDHWFFGLVLRGIVEHHAHRSGGAIGCKPGMEMIEALALRAAIRRMSAESAVVASAESSAAKTAHESAAEGIAESHAHHAGHQQA